jgi:hypothetical protein
MTIETPEPLPSLPSIPSQPRPAEYQRLAREIAGGTWAGLEPLGVALLGSSALDFLRPFFVVEGARLGFSVRVFVGEFAQLEQPILAPESSLYASSDVLALNFQPSDVAPDVFDRFYRTRGAELDEVCRSLTSRMVDAAREFRRKAPDASAPSPISTSGTTPVSSETSGPPHGPMSGCRWSLAHPLQRKSSPSWRGISSEPFRRCGEGPRSAWCSTWTTPSGVA